MASRKDCHQFRKLAPSAAGQISIGEKVHVFRLTRKKTNNETHEKVYQCVSAGLKMKA